jgi:hypothetical protein
MYFEYTSAQNYVRTITQGVNLSDSRRLTANYVRRALQTARVNLKLSRFETFYRKCEMTVRNTMNMNRLPLFSRTISENIRATMGKKENRTITRMCFDDVNVKSGNYRLLNVIRIFQESIKGLDSQSITFLYLRSVKDEAIANDKTSHWGSFIRGLIVKAGSTAETKHEANYYRFHSDTIQAKGSVFRGIMLYVRIVTGLFVRDYILRRFLKARSELVLKSPIYREIILDSKIG